MKPILSTDGPSAKPGAAHMPLSSLTSIPRAFWDEEFRSRLVESYAGANDAVKAMMDAASAVESDDSSTED